MLTYLFTNGQDLDTRTRIAIPDIGQDTQKEYLGWGVLSKYPTGVTETAILTWGGDNTATGYESVLIDVNEFKLQYPSAAEMVADLRAQWYGTVGTNPVTIGATLWNGGLPVKNGCVSGVARCWTNPTAVETLVVPSAGKVITLFSTSAISPGERVATLTYNLITGSGLINNDDTTTPAVL